MADIERARKVGFTKLDSPTHEGKTSIWLTPLPLIHSLGEFDLDPCGFRGHNTAKEIWYGPLFGSKCGLQNKWHGRVWLNPPYGREIHLWLKKLEEHGDGIALVFARTDTLWFHTMKPTLTYFLQGRIKFLNDKFQEDTNAGHGSLLYAWGKKNAGAILSSGLQGRWIR